MPGKHNIYIYCFLITGLSLAGLAFLKLSGNPDYDSVQRNVLVPTTVLSCMFGLLTLFTRPKRLAKARKKAHKEASRILQKMQSHDAFQATDTVVSVNEIARSLGFGDDIYDLYDLVPACFLPLKYSDPSPTLDWHKFDVCIISAQQDLILARGIENALRNKHPSLRVYVDGDDDIGFEKQDRLLRRVYHSGSHLCLALISQHLINDPRRRVQLNHARRREDDISKHRKIIDGRCATYLKPVPLDGYGLAFMAKATGLRDFVEFRSPDSFDNDRNRLFQHVVEAMLEELRKTSYHRPAEANENGHAESEHKVFISYSDHDKRYAMRFFRDLTARGFQCWFAPESMIIGKDIRRSVNEAIVDQKVLLVLSENAIQSSWVQDEADMALNRERENGETLLFPVKVDTSIDSANEGWAGGLLKERHIGDFTDWNNAAAYDRSLRQLIRALKSESKST